jgi:uncharacterized protein YPO0396
MHPDAIIAALRRELERLNKDADDYAESRKAIEAEIERVDGLERPAAVKTEDQVEVRDEKVAYLAALKDELERVADGLKDEVRKEIKRVEALIHKSSKEDVAADETTDGDDLESLTRDELNARAEAVGVESPDKLANKDAVIAAIEAAHAS